MAVPLIPFAGLALNALNALSLAAIAGLLLDREFGNDPEFEDPNPQIPPFTPPFTGGQCVGVRYLCGVSFRVFDASGNLLTTRTVDGAQRAISFGSLRGIRAGRESVTSGAWGVAFLGNDSLGIPTELFYSSGFSSSGLSVVVDSASVERQDGLPDSCGDLPNPNPPVPPSVGGGSLVPVVDSPIEVSGGLPIPSFAALLAALKTIADAIGAIGDVLEGVRKIGDAINKIREILDDFLGRENEKEKGNRNKRKVSVGAWREMPVDGGFGTGKFTAQNIEYSPYQLQIEIEAFPPTVSRRLGVNSPSYAHLEPIGWVFLRSSNGGYSEPVPIRYLRNSISLNEDTNGISFSFRENPLVKAKCRVWYSSDPEITGNI